MIATLPHLGTFVAGNLRFLALLAFLPSVGLRVRSQGSSGTLGCFGQILMLRVLPLLFLYSVAHLIVICPFACIGYLFLSAIVESITGSAKEMEIMEIRSSGKPQKFRVREIVASNPAATAV